MYSPEWAVVPEIDTPSKSMKRCVPPHELSDRISQLRREMMEAAEKLDYERAADLRDRIKRLERRVFGMDEPPAAPPLPRGSAHSGGNGAGRRPRRSTDATGPQQSLARRLKNESKPAPKHGRLKLTPDRPD